MIGRLVPPGLIAACALAVGAVRAPLAEGHARVRETSDVYVLPPPEDVVRLSLGYRAALADFLWSHVLVSQGLHTLDKRRFENLILFIDTINALDPQFREPYAMADTLITFQAAATPLEEVRKAREIMERGLEARPLDAELWLITGQFVSYIAPGSYLTDPEEQARWRQDGAKLLARAAVLAGGDAHIAWQALGGAGIFERAGARADTIRFLRDTLATTDDPSLKERLEKQLDALLASAKATEEFLMKRQLDSFRKRSAAFDELRRAELPFVSKGLYLVLGPPPEPAYCAGGAHANEPRCASTWRAWAEAMDARTAEGDPPAR